MKTKEELYEEIEAYLAGSMTGSELAAFERRLQQETDLKKQVALHRGIAAAVVDQEEQQFEKTLQSVVEEEGGGTVRFFARFPVMRYAAAAAIALLIGISIWWSVSNVLSTDSTQELFAENYQAYPGPPVLRGTEGTREYTPREEAFLAYQGQHYEEAKEGFTQLLANNNIDVELIFFQAICDMELGNTQQARDGFEMVIDQGNNFYLLQSRWYLALSWLKEGNTENAKGLLQELSKEKGKYGRQAQTLLEDL